MFDLNLDSKYKIAEQYAWTGLDLNTLNKFSQTNYNLFDGKNELEIQNPGLRELVLMNNPSYVWFAAKVLLNIELYPLQAAVLENTWKYSFPMLIASRGMGKSSSMGIYCLLRLALNQGIKIVVTGSAFRQSKIVFQYMEEVWKNSNVLRSIYNNRTDGISRGADQWTFRLGSSIATALPTGCLAGDSLITTDKGIYNISELQNQNIKVWSDSKYRKVGRFWDNGEHKVFKIKTNLGSIIECTPEHKFLVNKDGCEKWVKAQDLTLNDSLIIDRSERWFNPQYNFNPDEAYCLGLMLGDGCYTNKYKLGYTTIDESLIKSLQSNLADFKQQKDEIHYEFCGKDKVKEFKDKWGISEDCLYHNHKELPTKLLKSNKEAVRACLQGLFDTDGNAKTLFTKGGWHGTVTLYSTSFKLIQQVQFCLLHFGIISKIHYRKLRKSPRTGNLCKPAYELQITSTNILKFYNKIGFRLKRKQNIVKKYIENKKRWSVFESLPISKEFLIELSTKYNLPKKHIKGNKTYNQSFVDYYKKRLLELGVVSQELESFKEYYYYDNIVSIEDNNKIIPTYDLHIPDNNAYVANGYFVHNSGEKIRGMRSNISVVDEFNSIAPEVYQVVIENFGAVSMNPIASIKNEAYKAFLLAQGELTPESEEMYAATKNQSIITGTIGTKWEHFWDYLNTYKQIIVNKGKIVDDEKFVFNKESIDSINYKDYCVMRIPYDLIPKGFLSSEVINRAKATMHNAVFNSEYGCVPIGDTNGFFKLSSIEGATANNKNLDSPYWPEYCPRTFMATSRGNTKLQYIMGIDPASEQDNFAIVILELHPEHNRLVYCWTTNRKKYNDKDDKNFFSYCGKKIRDLMTKFNISAIVIDSQGGGVHVAEALHDKDKLAPGEQPIWPIIDPEDRQPTDEMPGLHLIHMFQPANAKIVSDANWSLLKDIQDKILLFPFFNSVELGLEHERVLREIVGEENQTKIYDEFEDVILEVEELKKELTYIEQTTTAAGRERWDTPGIKQGNKTVQNLRKDRYSALLMANYIARTTSRFIAPPNFNAYNMSGKAVGQSKIEGDILGYGQNSLVNQLNINSFRGINRG